MTLQHLDATGVTIPIPDLSKLVTAARSAAAALGAGLARFATAAAMIHEAAEERRRAIVQAAVADANRVGRVAGLEGRYAVRAGLDPAYATPVALDQLVASIMAARVNDVRLLTLENRAQVAAAAITGWCYSYGDGPAILAWHRLMGTTAVVVTRG